MPPRIAPSPPDPLYRVARGLDPTSFPPREFSGAGRFDDPRREFSVLYAAAQRRGAFVETLASFRPDVELIAEARRLASGGLDSTTPVAVAIPESYFRKLIGRLRPAEGQQWLDLRATETHHWLRTVMAERLVALGIRGNFVWGDLLSSDHRITRAIARFAYDRDYHGLVYRSSHDATLDCWAIFDRAIVMPVGSPEAITRADPDLVAVAELFDLIVPT
jgi:RES domain